jgi:hypothetical protein
MARKAPWWPSTSPEAAEATAQRLLLLEEARSSAARAQAERELLAARQVADAAEPERQRAVIATTLTATAAQASAEREALAARQAAVAESAERQRRELSQQVAASAAQQQRAIDALAAQQQQQQQLMISLMEHLRSLSAPRSGSPTVPSPTPLRPAESPLPRHEPPQQQLAPPPPFAPAAAAAGSAERALAVLGRREGLSLSSHRLRREEDAKEVNQVGGGAT